MRLYKKFMVLGLMCAGLTTLAGCGGSGDKAVSSAIDWYTSYAKMNPPNGTWEFKGIEPDGKDLVIQDVIANQYQLDIINGLSRMDKTVIARRGCPGYKTKFWEFIRHKYTDMEVWIEIYDNKNNRLTRVSCPFPQKGTMIQYSNTEQDEESESDRDSRKARKHIYSDE